MIIKDLEEQIGQHLKAALGEALAKFGYAGVGEPRVTLHDVSGRKKRASAAATNWSPDSGTIEIASYPAAYKCSDCGASMRSAKAFESHMSIMHNSTVEPAPEATTLEDAQPSHTVESSIAGGPSAGAPGTAPEGRPGKAEMELLRALLHAESTPGWSFVPLRKFKNEILPAECSSLCSEVERKAALQSVIDKKFVLLGKVINPKNPQFPVTTIRVNMLMPEVREALGDDRSPEIGFHPVEIRGEPLSATILRERR